MENEAIITPKMSLHARVFRAHPIPVGMSESDYKRRIALQDEQVGHWENLGQIASDEDGSLQLKSRTLQ